MIRNFFRPPVSGPHSEVLQPWLQPFCWTPRQQPLAAPAHLPLSAAQLKTCKNLLALALQIAARALAGAGGCCPGLFALLPGQRGGLALPWVTASTSAPCARLGNAPPLSDLSRWTSDQRRLAGVVFLAELPTQAQWAGLTLISPGAWWWWPFQQPPAGRSASPPRYPGEWVLLLGLSGPALRQRCDPALPRCAAGL